MATTAGGTPYVESSDLVANYPAVSLALAEHIDALPQKILQVLNVVKTDAFSTTSTSNTDVTGLSLTITPTSDTSKILVFANVAGTTTDVSNAGNAGYQIVRGSTDIGVGTGGSNQQYTAVLGTRLMTSAYEIMQSSVIVLDSPATTTAVIYKITVRTAGGTLYINRQRDYENGMISTLTLMEVAA